MILQAQDIVGSYFWLRSSLFLVITNSSGSVLDMNPFARVLVQNDDYSGPFLGLLVQFQERMNWDEIEKDSGENHLWSVNRPNDTPVSFYFGFSRIDAGYMIVGEQNLTEVLTYQSRFLEISREMSQLTRSLQKTNADLDAKNRQIKLFLGMAAHDMRNPVGAILNFSEFLEEEIAGQVDQKNMGFLNKITQLSEFMLGLLEDLLDVVAIQHGQVKLKVEEFDLLEMIQQNIVLNSMVAKKKGIDILFETTETTAIILADPYKLEQVLNNLISNAIKYSTEGSFVQVRLGRRQSEYLIQVIDQGVGISEDQIDDLFRPFATKSRSGTSGEKSTGLGLVIVKHIVEAHGGQISVASSLGDGSKFSIELPVNQKRNE